MIWPWLDQNRSELTAQKSVTMTKRRVGIICAVLICAAGVWWLATASRRSPATSSYTEFLQGVRAGQVASVIVFGSNTGAVQVTGRLKDGSSMRTVLPADYRDALAAMQERRVEIEIRDASSEPLRLMTNAMPFLLLLGFWVILMLRKLPRHNLRG
jgi:ATP-dependent Zn protease